jgi:hypothetical protein
MTDRSNPAGRVPVNENPGSGITVYRNPGLFLALRHMRDAFVAMKATRQGWLQYNRIVGEFFDAYATAKTFAQQGDGDLVTGITRTILEAVCERDGIPLESSVVPGEPARNYELALRLRIGKVFGLRDDPGEDDPHFTQEAVDWAVQLAESLQQMRVGNVSPALTKDEEDKLKAASGYPVTMTPYEAAGAIHNLRHDVRDEEIMHPDAIAQELEAIEDGLVEWIHKNKGKDD